MVERGRAVCTTAASICLVVGLSVAPADAARTPTVAVNLTPLTQPAVAAAAAVQPPPQPFAKSAGLSLLPPAKKAVRYTYHESMFGEALSLRPRGRAKFVGHPKFRPPKRTPGPRYFVLPSRGRGTGPATAADVVLRKGTKVLSPVSGTVVGTMNFKLYCSRPDTRIILRPEGRPDLRVVIFHVDRPRVQRGDKIVAGETTLARVRHFTNSRAQYDDFVPGNHPHIHLEVQRGKVFPVPGCK